MSDIYKNNKIKVLEVAPIMINDENWFCAGFEPVNENMGDFFHLALIHDKRILLRADNIWEDILNAFFDKSILLRIHSECILGDSFGSTLCDCRAQLESAINFIVDQGSGIIIYLRQEGRGIGLRAKLSCLALQEGYIGGVKKTHKHTPDEANIVLGYSLDERDYTCAADFLDVLGSKKIEIITGNPAKVKTLEERGFEVTSKNMTSRVDKLSNRQVIELSEKVNRGYNYPELELTLKKTKYE